MNYCKNCKNFWVLRDSGQIQPRIKCRITGKLIKNSILLPITCKDYKRKWWKFWIKAVK